MPYRAAECLCVRLGPSALQVASNLSQSARSGSDGIVISSPGSRPVERRVEDPKTNKAVALQDFSLRESLLKRSYWDTKFSSSASKGMSRQSAWSLGM
jgi:hypothetical protein